MSKEERTEALFKKLQKTKVNVGSGLEEISLSKYDSVYDYSEINCQFQRDNHLEVIRIVVFGGDSDHQTNEYIISTDDASYQFFTAVFGAILHQRTDERRRKV